MPTRPALTVLLLACAVLGGWTAPAAVAAAAWIPPVPGPPTRLFDLGRDPFAPGQHRGVDLDTAPGERVRSACGGSVVFTGRVAGAGTVSVRCGPWRVTYAPLDRIAVRAGARVGPGSRLGRASVDAAPGRSGRAAGQAGRAAGHAGRAAGHAGLHFGVRRESKRFGYVDPLRFLAGPRRAPPPVFPARPLRPRLRGAPPPVLPARPAPRPHLAVHPSRPPPGLAPWPVWLGLALLMTGLAGAGTLRSPFRRQEGAPCRASSTSSSSPTTPNSP
jgi:Peptidase family M23